MASFVSARESCVHKSDFDYCMKNWKTIITPKENESLAAWTYKDKKSFRKKLLASIKTIVNNETNPIPPQPPQEILDVLKHEDFHSITMLDVINKADKTLEGNKERIVELSKVLTNFWMESSYLTQILISLSRDPTTSLTMYNVRNFYCVLFTMGEKLLVGSPNTKLISFFLTKIDTVLRIMVERDDSRILEETSPYAICHLIERNFLRYCTGMYRSFEPGNDEYFDENPFIEFMKRLMQLSQRNYRIQRLISNILLYINCKVAQERILCCWIALSEDTSNLSSILFYPVANFVDEDNWSESLIKTIPFNCYSNFSTRFWTNWAKYLTSDLEVIPVVWDMFMEHFWDLVFEVTDGERLMSPAFAFTALAMTVKPKLVQLKEIVRVTHTLDHITRLMETCEESLVQIAMAVSHILFDLDRIQQEVKTGKTISKHKIFDCDGDIYVQLLALYEGEDVSTKKKTQSGKELCVVNEQENDEGDGNNSEEDDGLDDRVRRLRCAGLTPTSMKDVYHILIGETTGTNDSETEALKQVAVLTIPILMSSGQTADDAHVESIARTLYEWGEDVDLDDFLTVALFELGKGFPDIISKTLTSMIFSKNYSAGDKSHMLKITEKILIFCGTSRCVCCFSMYGPYKKDDMNKFIRRMEPAFFPKYLHLNRAEPLCITCPPPPEKMVEEKQESLLLKFTDQAKMDASKILSLKSESKPVPLPIQETNDNHNPGPPVQRPPPPTRRWGTKRKENIEAVASKKKTLHLSLWAHFHHHLSVGNDTFLNEISAKDSVEIQFLLQILTFLNLLLVTYTGLNCFVRHIVKEVFILIQIYCGHPDVKIRRAVWGLLIENFKNIHMFEPNSLVDVGILNESIPEFLKSKIENENDVVVREYITSIRHTYQHQKFKLMHSE